MSVFFVGAACSLLDVQTACVAAECFLLVPEVQSEIKAAVSSFLSGRVFNAVYQHSCGLT